MSGLFHLELYLYCLSFMVPGLVLIAGTAIEKAASVGPLQMYLSIPLTYVLINFIILIGVQLLKNFLFEVYEFCMTHWILPFSDMSYGGVVIDSFEVLLQPTSL